MTLHELAKETAENQAVSEGQAFERAMSRIKPKPDILRAAAETIQRLGSAAQDCKSCARLTLCNAYQTENRFENCEYKWVYADEVTG
jgi:hypothetical protein